MDIIKERKLTLVAIAAISKNRCIGAGNKLPWKLPSDLGRFKTRTSGHHLIVGRSTYESIGRPLPKRTMIVLSSTSEYNEPGLLSARSMEEALMLCPPKQRVFVIGGSKIYEQFLPYCAEVDITEVDVEIAGDAFFPALGPEWCDERNVSPWVKWENDQYPTRIKTHWNANFFMAKDSK